MKIKVLGLIAACSLSACFGSDNVTTVPQTVTWKNNVAAQGVETYNRVEVRTYIETGHSSQNNTGTNKELPGARCTIDNADYSVSFVTPGVVELPYRGRDNSPEQTVVCEHDGKQTQRVIKVINLTGYERASKRLGRSRFFGAAGVIVGGVTALEIQKERPGDVFGYLNEVRVLFTNIEK